MDMIKKIIDKYNLDGKLEKIETNEIGNINNTYVATFILNDGSKKKYLIQKINTSVFTEPYKLMKNIDGVTTYLKNEMLKDRAELENFKRRTNEERIKDRKYANQDFFQELIGILDVFDKAVSVKTDDPKFQNYLI